MRAASIRATSAFSGTWNLVAAASSPRQKIGSSVIDVAWPAIITDRLTGPATCRINTYAGRR